MPVRYNFHGVLGEARALPAAVRAAELRVRGAAVAWAIPPIPPGTQPGGAGTRSRAGVDKAECCFVLNHGAPVHTSGDEPASGSARTCALPTRADDRWASLRCPYRLLDGHAAQARERAGRPRDSLKESLMKGIPPYVPVHPAREFRARAAPRPRPPPRPQWPRACRAPRRRPRAAAPPPAAMAPRARSRASTCRCGSNGRTALPRAARRETRSVPRVTHDGCCATHAWTRIRPNGAGAKGRAGETRAHKQARANV